jgi:hypothetical protein
MSVKVLLWGPPQSDKADPDLGWPRAVSSGAFFPFVHGVLDVTGGDVVLLDPSGPALKEQTLQGQR